MERREVMAGGGSALAVGGLGIYFATRDDGVSTPSGVSQRTVYVQDMVVKSDDTYERMLEVDDGELTVFETGSAARRRLIDTERVNSFVESVDFETSRLLAAETFVGITDEIELTEITRSGETLTLHVDEIDNPGSDAGEYHSLLVALRSESPVERFDFDVTFTSVGP